MIYYDIATEKAETEGRTMPKLRIRAGNIPPLLLFVALNSVLVTILLL